MTQIISGGAGAPLRTPEKYGGINNYILFNVDAKAKKVDMTVKKFKNVNYPFRSFVKNNIFIEYAFYGKNIPNTLNVHYRTNSNSDYSVMKMKKSGNKFFLTLKKIDSKKEYFYFTDENNNTYKYKNKWDFRVWLK